MSGIYESKLRALLESAGIAIGGSNPWDITVHNPHFYKRVVTESHLGIGESYMDGWWDCEALDQFFYRVLRARLDAKVSQASRALGNILGVLVNLQKPSRAFTVGEVHYNVGNDLYEAMLDKRMLYSCGYWKDARNLNEAQENKLRLIFNKLELQPGMRVLDIGCGWGGLSLYAAQHYGVQVLGVTLSQAQLQEGQARVRVAGLEGQVQLELRDYRDVLSRGPAQFDKIASVGMAEHVGRRNMPEYFRSAYAALKPGGLMLNHAIGDGIGQARVPMWLQSGNFARKYVFPDGELLPVWETLKYASEQLFEVRDVENLREHYALTIGHWAARLEAHRPEALALLGEERLRLWRLYLGATSYYFRKGHLTLFQSLLAKPDAERAVPLPLSRAGLYR